MAGEGLSARVSAAAGAVRSALAGARRNPRRLFALALAAILAVAFALRWVRTPIGLPYVHHWDEVYITNPPVAMLKTGSFNPAHFYYGTFYLYVQAAVDAAHFLRLQQTEQDEFEEVRSVQQLRFGEDGWIWWVSHPSFYLANRRTTVVFGAATVLLLALCARRWIGDGAALLAAAALATAGPHIEHSAFATTDVPALCLILLSAALAGIFVERQEERRAGAGAAFGFLAGSAFVAGLAAATKYNAILAVLAPATALALVWRRIDRRSRTLGLLLVALVPGLAFLAGMPYALFDLPRFLDHFGFDLWAYRNGSDPQNLIAPGWPHFWRQLGNAARGNALAVALTAPFGLLWLVRRRAFLPLGVTGLALVVVQANQRLSYQRNFLVLHVLAALGFAAAAAWLLARTGSLRWPKGRRPALFALGALFVLPLLGQAWRHWTHGSALGSQPETRTVATQRLAAVAERRQWKSIGWASELHIHPSAVARLGRGARQLPAQQLLCAVEEFDAVVLPTALTAIDERPFHASQIADYADRRFPRGILEVAGRPTGIDIFSENPGVRVLARADLAEPGGLCGRIDLDPAVRGAGAQSRESVTLYDAGLASTGSFWLPQGKFALSWRAGAGEIPLSQGTVTARIERLVQLDPPRAETLAEVILPVPAEGRHQVLYFGLPFGMPVRAVWTANRKGPETSTRRSVVLENFRVEPFPAPRPSLAARK